MSYFDTNVKLRSHKQISNDREEVSMIKAQATSYTSHVIANSKQRKKSVYVKKRKFNWERLQKDVLGYSRHPQFREVTLQRGLDPSTAKQQIDSICYVPVGGDSGMEYLGKYPAKIGKKPTTCFGPTLSQMRFWHSSEVPDAYRIEDISEHVCVSGGFNGSLPHFRSFARDNNWKYKSLIGTKRLVQKVINRFETPYELNIPSAAAIWFMPIKPVSNPGGETGFYFNKKGFAWASCCKAAVELWETVSKDLSFNYSIYTLGDRPKRNKNVVNGDDLSCRLVMMQDFVEYLLARPFTYLIEKWLFNLYNSPIKIGKSNARFGFYDITTKDRIYPYAIEIDWSFFDSSQRADIIIGAFGIVRGLFPESDLVDKLFFYFCDGLLNKYVLQSDGNLFFVKQGLPSGSVWTTIINSFANCILMEYIGSKYSAFKNTEYDYDVAGDDGKLFFKEPVSFRESSLIAWTKRKLNMDLKVEKSGFPIDENPDKSITFLKTCLYFDENGVAMPTTPPSALKTRLSCPQRRLKTYSDVHNFIFSQSESLLVHPASQDLVARYLRWVIREEGSNDPFIVATTYNDVMSMINSFNMMVYFAEGTGFPYGMLKATMGDRIVPALCEDTDYSIDYCYVTNWLNDNTQRLFRKKPTTFGRYTYLAQMLGKLENVSNFLKLLPTRLSRFARKQGFSTKNLSNIRKLYRFYTSGGAFT